MQIKPEQLLQRLKPALPPFIWISGDEMLLVQESCDTVRQQAREQGFTGRDILDAGSGFDWNQLLSSGNELSLFAERKLIDVRVSGNKLDDPARVALSSYLENPNPDNVLLLTTGKIDKASQSTKWFKHLENLAVFCPVWPVNEQQLPGWIGQRLAQFGISADQDALDLLATRVEGNLLAAAQEVEKLRMQINSDHIDLALVQNSVADNARFNVFALTDACLSGNTERALRVLWHLRDEGEESLMILAMLCREIRSLSAMIADMDAGHNLHAVMQTHRVWSNRTAQVTRALKVHRQSSLQALLGRARRVDQTVKGLESYNPWDELSDLVMRFSDPRLLVGVI